MTPLSLTLLPSPRRSKHGEEDKTTPADEQFRDDKPQGEEEREEKEPELRLLTILKFSKLLQKLKFII